jgi:hypothetical protein
MSRDLLQNHKKKILNVGYDVMVFLEGEKLVQGQYYYINEDPFQAQYTIVNKSYLDNCINMLYSSCSSTGMQFYFEGENEHQVIVDADSVVYQIFKRKEHFYNSLILLMDDNSIKVDDEVREIITLSQINNPEGWV